MYLEYLCIGASVLAHLTVRMETDPCRLFLHGLYFPLVSLSAKNRQNPLSQHRPCATYIPLLLLLIPQIYDARSDSIAVTPFQLWANPASLTHMLALPDRELLAVTSTSPDVEDERFTTDVRAQFAYVLDNMGADGRGWWDNVFGGGRGRALVFPRCEA